MREDTGLLDGIETIWQEGLAYDYTLKVEDKEIRVHKFVLASVSDYFRAMLCGSMSESTNDSVVLEEVNAELLLKLVKYIYTGDNSFISSRPKEVLEMAVYFQMPKVIEKCQQNLMTDMSVENCLDLLSIFKAFSVKEGVDQVTTFIKSNAAKVVEHYDAKGTTSDALEIVLDAVNWIELGLFFYLIQWFEADFDNRKQYADRFMSHVKFYRMSDEDISVIRKQMTCIKVDGAWKSRFQKAYIYHRQPIHKKILNNLEQTKIDNYKSAIAINVKQNPNGSSTFSFLHHFEDGKAMWKMCSPVKTPRFTGTVPFVIEVNNFLITCSEFGKNQMWQVFDPRTLTWSKMAKLSQPRDMFTMVQHDRHLYVLGGCIGSTSRKFLTDTIEEYNFDTGTWSSTKKLPVAVKNHSACTLNGCIYVSGGQITTGIGSVSSARVDCLNVSTGTWESKAAMLRPMANHKMCVMMVEEKETIVVIDRDMRIQFYDPPSDQWSTCEFSVNKHGFRDFRAKDDTTTVDVKDLKWASESRMFVDGNTVYLLNLKGQELEYYENKDDFKYWDDDSLCVKWVVAEEKRHVINEYTMSGSLNCYFHSGMPLDSNPEMPLNIIYGFLAFPSGVLQYI